MENIGRDKVVQTGDQSSVKIDNHQAQEKKWYQTGLGQIVIGIVVVIGGGALLHFLDLN